jgi:hypothetical protein
MPSDDSPLIYHIRIAGHLDERWQRWFDGMSITLLPAGETLISGPVVDQSALHGMLSRIRDLGLELISVQQDPSHASNTERNET